jgi:hypothetical protein
MCVTKIQTYLYCNEIKKCKHEKNKIKLWCKIVLQTSVEHTKNNAVLHLFTFLWGPSSKKLPCNF